MASLAKTMFLKVGPALYQVATFEQASKMFCAARDVYGEGASKTPRPDILDACGKVIANISYNGRVWSGDNASFDNSTVKMLFDPCGEPCPYSQLRERGIL